MAQPLIDSTDGQRQCSLRRPGQLLLEFGHSRNRHFQSVLVCTLLYAAFVLDGRFHLDQEATGHTRGKKHPPSPRPSDGRVSDISGNHAHRPSVSSCDDCKHAASRCYREESGEKPTLFSAVRMHLPRASFTSRRIPHRQASADGSQRRRNTTLLLACLSVPA